MNTHLLRRYCCWCGSSTIIWAIYAFHEMDYDSVGQETLGYVNARSLLVVDCLSTRKGE